VIGMSWRKHVRELRIPGTAAPSLPRAVVLKWISEQSAGNRSPIPYMVRSRVGLAGCWLRTAG
jgi:hypothetical protein